MTSPAAFAELPAPLPAPSALGTVLRRVVNDHPYAASGALHADSPRLAADAAALWDRLGALVPAALTAEVQRLRTREVQVLAATARARLGDAACVGVLAAVLVHREVPGAAALAWDAWLFTAGDEQFRPGAHAYATEDPGAPALWRRLLAGASPAQVAAAQYLGAGGSFDGWAGRRDVGLVRHARFLDHVRRALLAPGGLGALDAAVDSETIATWVAYVPAGDRDAWYAAFLNQTHWAKAVRNPHARWPARHAVCAAVLDRARAPSDALPFWEAVTPGARDAFTLWCKDRELTALLGGENERVAFWRRYLPSITRLEPNEEHSVVFIHGRGWVAVQFILSGRATFLFKEAAGRAWRRMPEADLYHWVLRLRRVRHDAFLGSYEHRGYAETWQRQASAEVEQAIRRVQAQAVR